VRPVLILKLLLTSVRNKVDLSLHDVPPASEVDLPTPVFIDPYVTVYGLPSGSLSSSARGTKRKRSPSPLTAAPVHTNGTTTSHASSPSAGKRARDYIKTVVADMFHGPNHVHAGPRPTPAWDARSLPEPSPPDVESASFLVVGPVHRGKFRPDLAKKLGVKPGPAFGQLHRGERVQLKDGTWVEPSDCVEADGPKAVRGAQYKRRV
jgi:ribonuclease BN (tRNA processing enzyme)